jgi:hypothetical protein
VIVLPSYYKGNGAGVSNPALVRPNNFTDLGKTPEFACNWGAWDGAAAVANKNTTSGWGDPTEAVAISGAFEVDFNPEPAEAGGKGYIKTNNTGQWQLQSADHALADGPFTISLWQALPFGLASVSGSLLFAGNISSTRMWIAPSGASQITFYNNATTKTFQGIKTGPAKNNLVIVREDDDTIKFYINGILAWDAGTNTGSLATHPLYFGSAQLTHALIAAHVWDEALDASDIDTYWNRGAGTFWEAEGNA